MDTLSVEQHCEGADRIYLGRGAFLSSLNGSNISEVVNGKHPSAEWSKAFCARMEKLNALVKDDSRYVTIEAVCEELRYVGRKINGQTQKSDRMRALQASLEPWKEVLTTLEERAVSVPSRAADIERLLAGQEITRTLVATAYVDAAGGYDIALVTAGEHITDVAKRLLPLDAGQLTIIAPAGNGYEPQIVLGPGVLAEEDYATRQ